MGKRGYVDRLAANLRRLGDPVERDHYIKLLAEKTGTSEAAIREKLEKPAEAPVSRSNEASTATNRLGELLFKHPGGLRLGKYWKSLCWL